VTDDESTGFSRHDVEVKAVSPSRKRLAWLIALILIAALTALFQWSRAELRQEQGVKDAIAGELRTFSEWETQERHSAHDDELEKRIAARYADVRNALIENYGLERVREAETLFRREQVVTPTRRPVTP
jgi:hypothetical protein